MVLIQSLPVKWVMIMALGSLMSITVSRYPLSVGLLGLLASYVLYYLIFVVKRPRIYGRPGGVKDRILRGCPILSRSYWPPFWAWNCHMCTIGRPLMQKKPCLSYERWDSHTSTCTCTCSVLTYVSTYLSLSLSLFRQVIPLPDGGDLALDWAVCKGDQYTPIFLILPGLTGTCIYSV